MENTQNNEDQAIQLKGEVQTRSDPIKGRRFGKYPGLFYWKTIKEAHDAYLADPGIWKISFTLKTDTEPIDLQFIQKTVNLNDRFTKKEEEKLCELNEAYQREFLQIENSTSTNNNKTRPYSDMIFWIKKTIIPDNWEKVRNISLSEEERSILWNTENIKAVYTDEEFVTTFCH